MCVDKKNGYDLLNVKKIDKDIALNSKKSLNTKLETVAPVDTTVPALHINVAAVKPSTPSIPFDLITAVCDHIKMPAGQQEHEFLEKKLKKEYWSIPNPILHADELPTLVYAHIKLKDEKKVILMQNYKCLRKYRPAFASLLQTHLNLGKLHPSNSPFASPAFIMPKKDPAAAPHWVNNYQQLNANTIDMCADV